MFLDSKWQPQLDAHVQAQLGPMRARLMGRADTSSNLFKNVVEQVSVLYHTPPEIVKNPALSDSFEAGEYWTMAVQHQCYVRGLLESLVYVGWDDDEEHVTFELVTPDFITAEAAKTNPGRPVVIWRGKQRDKPGRYSTEQVWCWDRWDITDPMNPSFTIWTNDRRREITENYVNPYEWRGVRYPYRDERGKGILPFTLYHARGAVHGLWNPDDGSEVVFGTKQIGLIWSASVHGVLRASWNQRVLANGRVRGAHVQDAGGQKIASIDPDPTMVLQVEGNDVKWGSFEPGMDIEKAEKFSRLYENRLAVHFGMSPADLVVEAMNPASGASITVSQAGKRMLAKRDLVNFSLGDIKLCNVVAAVNRAHGVACSAKGVRLKYRGVDLTIHERGQVATYVQQELEAGIIDEVEAYQETHPGISAEDAAEAIKTMAMRKKAMKSYLETLRQLDQPAGQGRQRGTPQGGQTPEQTPAAE